MKLIKTITKIRVTKKFIKAFKKEYDKNKTIYYFADKKNKIENDEIMDHMEFILQTNYDYLNHNKELLAITLKIYGGIAIFITILITFFIYLFN
jgi:hypothetical protein